MILSRKKILFVTGTRADFGKLKSLIQITRNHQAFDVHLFVTGMHLLHEYGYTIHEIEKCGFNQIHAFANHTHETTMDLTLAKTIEGLSAFVHTLKPDMIVVHGDRSEALAGAITGSLNNILVAHIEGGEVSGTIDELIRHAVSKMSQVHFVSNENAKQRLIQMGEETKSIFVIGSPDVDVMKSNTLPDIQLVKSYYEIPFEQYAIAMFHPVTTEVGNMEQYANTFVDALLNDTHHYIVVFPNNDLGSSAILKAYERLSHSTRIKLFPSLRFEYFLVLLKYSQFIIGNSSAGIREAPYYGIPTVNIGNRQQNRALHPEIIDADYTLGSIKEGIAQTDSVERKPQDLFGDGKSDMHFLETLLTNEFWTIRTQKVFNDIV